MRSPLLGAAIAAALISIAGTENNQLPMRRLETLELDTAFRRERTHIEAFEMPQLASTLALFMREPGLLLELSVPVVSMEVVSDSSEDLREWLFAQTVSVSRRVGGTAITMVYAGLADGRFVGCKNLHPICLSSARAQPRCEYKCVRLTGRVPSTCRLSGPRKPAHEIHVSCARHIASQLSRVGLFAVHS